MKDIDTHERVQSMLFTAGCFLNRADRPSSILIEQPILVNLVMEKGFIISGLVEREGR